MADARDEAMDTTCRRCGGEMQPGIAMGQTYTGSLTVSVSVSVSGS